MTERLRFAEKLREVEAEKAEKRKKETQFGNSTVVENSPHPTIKGKTREFVAEKSGIGSSNTLKRAEFISQNQSFLSPEDFANWDHNKLSTNKAYQKIVAEVVSSMV